MSLLRKRLTSLLVVCLLAASMARAAVTIADVFVTNVGTTTFTVVWTTSEESTPGLEVYSDAAGTLPLTSSLGLDYYPIAMGDPAVTNSTSARTARRALELLAMQHCAVSVRVTGLAPGTTYHVRPRTFGANGADNGTGLLPLVPATTAQSVAMLSDARILRIQIPTFAAQGMILLVQGPAGTTPMSAIVGDSAASNVGLFSSALIVDTATGTNAAFNSPQQFLIRALGAGAPPGTSTQTVTFTGNFVVAMPQTIDAPIESPGPFITTQPVDKTVVVGLPATFTVAASGTPPPTYKWQRKPAGSAIWSDLTADLVYSGVTAATLTISNTSLAMSGDQFRAIATNGVPPDATSNAATLTVTPAAVAPAITIPPAPVSVIAGTNATFAVVATGIPAPTYQWQRQIAGDTAWNNLIEGGSYAGVATATLTVVAPTLAMSGDQFRVVVSNGVPPNATSGAVALTVTTASVAPSFTTQPTAKTVGAGSDTTFPVVATGTPTPAIKWQIRLAGTSNWIDLTATVNYSGVDTATLSVKAATIGMSGDQFRAIASNGTPPDATSNVATLTVVISPTITGHPQSVTVPSGSNTGFAVTASGTGTLGFQWQRLPAGSQLWQDIVANAMYVDPGTADLKVNGVLPAMTGDQFRCVVTDALGSNPSNAATLTVSKAAASVTLGDLRQWYNGAPRSVTVATVPGGLNTVLTYAGSDTAPTVPGVYSVVAQIVDPAYAGSATADLVIVPTVLVRHASTIAGSLDGSLQLATAEDMSLTGTVSGDLLLPGTPTLATNGGATVAGTRDGPGLATPTAHTVTLETTAVLRYLVRHVDGPVWPTLPAVPAPAGTRNVVLSAAGQTAGDFATVRNLNISGSVGSVAVPPGTYGTLTANGTTAFVLGVANATEPVVYNLQGLSINPLQSTAKLVVVGPVVINVAGTVALYGDTGVADHPEWLTINASAAVSTNSRANLRGSVVAPISTVTLNGTSTISGRITADKVNVAANAAIKQAP